MKIQIVSDLHLEFPENRKWITENPIVPVGDVLLIAGDTICDKYKKKARAFYEKVSAEFPFIISTMGNHEFYHGIIDYAYPTYKSSISHNHIRLNNQTHVIEDVKFIVSILWSHVPVSQQGMISTRLNDYQYISHKDPYGEKYPISVSDTNDYHDYSIKYILEELDKPFSGKIIVMTHHLPSFECVSKSKKGDALNFAYASKLDELILSNPKIKYWICGHSHDFSRIQIGETTIIRNPLGYVFEQQQRDFKRNYVVEV
jgi:DNA repair exonuclease SbcCD nuclease subunit